MTAEGDHELRTQEQLMRLSSAVETLTNHVEDSLVRIKTLETELHSTDPRSLGIAVRMLQIETYLKQVFGLFKWTVGGGAVSAALTLGLLIRIAQLLAAAAE